jgi:hypothetical protein
VSEDGDNGSSLPPFASGKLEVEVEAKRGRCTELAERYIAAAVWG